MVSFISIAFVFVKLKIFKFFRIDSTAMEWSLFGWFWALLPQILFDLAEILNRDSAPIRVTQCLKSSSKFSILAQMECTQSLQFWSILGSNLLLENQKYCLKPKFLEKLHP